MIKNNKKCTLVYRKYYKKYPQINMNIKVNITLFTQTDLQNQAK